MSYDIIEYGSVDPIQFKFTLNGVGVNPTLVANDVVLVQDGVVTATMGLSCSQIGSSLTPGLHEWIPPNTIWTQGKSIILNIKDQSGTGRFDENCIIISTGGHALSRFNG